MLYISTNKSSNEGRKSKITQAAAIQFKNMAQTHWRFRDDTHARDACVDGFRFIIISEDDKVYVRDNILELILQCKDDDVVRQLNYAVECIARTDFPEKWPGLAEQMHAYIHTEDESKILLGLESLKSVCKRYEFEYGVGRKPLDEIVNALFPRLEEIVGQVQENTSYVAFDIKHRIAELLFVVNQINVTERYSSKEGFQTLINFYQYALECTIDEGLISKTDDKDIIAKRKDRPEWKVKVVAMRFFFRMFQKYGNPKFCSDDDHDVQLSEMISNPLIFNFIGSSYNEAFIKIATTMISQTKDYFISPDVLTYSIKICSQSMKNPLTINMFLPH
jgi:importin-7